MYPRAKITIQGLHLYRPTIFLFLNTPSGVQRENVVFEIITECGELECLYPDPDIMQDMVETWSNTRLHAWERMYNALIADYDALHNYDRHEESEDENDVESTPGTVSTHSVAAYNESEPQVRERDAVSGTSTGHNKSTHKAHLFGNIGVTTSQEMLKSELDLRSTDIYKIIAQEFKEKFCVMVY